MKLRVALAFLFLAACTRQSSAVIDAPDAADDAAVAVADADAAAALSDAMTAMPASEPTTVLAADGGFAALLTGVVSPANLPEVATDRGAPLDRQLRERLTTVEVPDPDGDDGALGAALQAFGGPGLHENSGGTGGSGDGGAGSGAVTMGAVSTTSPIEHADRVVAGVRPRVRACYNMGLVSDPAMSGKLVITAKVDAKGEVSEAAVASNSGLSLQVANCVARTVRNLLFDAPAGGAGATLTVPLTLYSK